jgi:hypothetical protein
VRNCGQLFIEYVFQQWPVFGRSFSPLTVFFFDRFSVQSISQKLFEKIILREFSQSLEPAASSVSPSFESLSKDELNVLQYACGYVPQHFY